MPEHADIDLILEPGWLLPIAPVNEVLAGYSLAIDQGRILALGPSDQVQANWRAREHLRLPDHVVLPGLVNAHGHAAMSLLRGLGEGLPLQRWLEEVIWPVEGRWASEAFIQDGTQLAMAEMVRTGTTCFSDMYFFPEASARAAQLAGMRAQILFPLIQFPNPWSRDISEGLDKGLRLHDQYRDDPLLRIGFGPHAPYTVPDADLQRILTLADELDLQIQTHLHETAGEVDQARQQTGLSHIERFADLGLLVPRLQAVHMTQINERELSLVAETGVSVIHCPQSNLKLASGFCPVPELLAAGVRVGLGTDGAASNDSLDMFTEMRFASLLAKARSGDPAQLTALQMVETATLGGARALDLADRIGSLEPGKEADLIAVDLGGVASQPVYAPQAQLVHTNAGSLVSHVWVAGRALLTNGQLQTLDSTAINRRARNWGRQIQAGLDEG